MADDDKFDTLPDALLSVIVSSLPFKEAVRTSILSKRWTTIWQATKNIELEESFFVDGDETNQRIKEEKRREFVNFATNFIRIYQEPTLRKFSLAISNPKAGDEFVDECIRFAVSHDVETLELDFSNAAWSDDDDNERLEITFDLPPIVYRHGNLRSLKLFACGFRPGEFGNNWTVLKDLRLGWIEVGVGEIRDLTKRCLGLESLSLKKCWNVSHFEIGGNGNGNGEELLRLRSLAIEKCSFLHDWISIEAMNLRYFRYFGSVASFRIEVERCVFEEADVGFEIDEDDDDSAQIANLLYALLDCLYPAKVLTVCSSLLQVIPKGDEPIRMQGPLNVQHLKLKTNVHPNEFYGITFLLNSCPHLKKLTLMLGQGKIFQEYEPPFPMDTTSFWATNMVIIKCLSQSLETVEIKCFSGKQNEINFLGHLLHYGRVLRNLSLVVDSSEITNSQLYVERAQILRNITPASNNVRIHIS